MRLRSKKETPLGLQARFSLVLGGVFLVGLLAAGAITYKIQFELAKAEVLEHADAMMQTAIAAREYTSEEVAGRIAALQEEVTALRADGSELDFVRQTVPAYSAYAIYGRLSSEYRDYRYKEAVENPTNPHNRAVDWELEVIEEFRARKAEGAAVDSLELRSQHDRLLYLARPIEISSEMDTQYDCLRCHRTPAEAPQNMVEFYSEQYVGWPYTADGESGFDWPLDRIIGARIVTLPSSLAEKKAWGSLLVLWGALASVFVLCFIVVNAMIRQVLARPLTALAAHVNDVSIGKEDPRPLPDLAGGEIGSLARSVTRMSRSLSKAVRDAEGRDGD